MPTDEDLAKTMFATVFGRSRDWDFTAPADQGCWMRGIRALRNALTPPVAPLRPGETVTIRNAPQIGDMDDLVLSDADGLLRVNATNYVDCDASIPYAEVELFLDAAGVAKLRETCARFEAAQGEGNDG